MAFICDILSLQCQEICFLEIQLSSLGLVDVFSASYWDLVKRFCNLCLLSSQGFDEGECKFAGDLSVELYRLVKAGTCLGSSCLLGWHTGALNQVVYILYLYYIQTYYIYIYYYSFNIYSILYNMIYNK